MVMLDLVVGPIRLAQVLLGGVGEEGVVPPWTFDVQKWLI